MNINKAECIGPLVFEIILRIKSIDVFKHF